jgi:hypothetical protein
MVKFEPINLKIIDVKKDSVMIEWNKISVPCKYELTIYNGFYKDDGNENNSMFDRFEIDEIPYIIKNLKSNTEYSCKIVALLRNNNIVDMFSFSKAINVKTF